MNKRIINPGFESPTPPLTTSFNTVLYTGNSSTQSITGVGFQPDLVWIKRRNTTEDHALFDSVRGALKMISSNLTAAEYTTYAPYEAVSSFDSDGFTTRDNGATNRSPNTYVAWCWKAGGAAVTNNFGSIESQVSANPGAGFSVVSYTAASSGSFTVGHGLASEPKMVITRRTGGGSNWYTYHSETGAEKFLSLNSTAAASGTIPNFWGLNGMSTTTIGLTVDQACYGNQFHIAYCFAEVAGFSKFGSYTGTGVAGNFQDCGFEPAFVMIKSTDKAINNWDIFDNKRDTTNPNTALLQANTSGAELYPPLGINFLANGFEPENAYFNDSGNNFIYMAFANQF